jgi:hypothetical protein
MKPEGRRAIMAGGWGSGFNRAMQSDGGGTIKTVEMVRSVHVLTFAAQYLINLLDQWLEERLGIVSARAQQPAMPVVGFLVSSEIAADRVAAFRQGLKESGFIEGQNVAIEFGAAQGQYDRLPALVSELVRRPVAVIFAGAPPTALAAKAATTTIPIVFQVGDDPVKVFGRDGRQGRHGIGRFFRSRRSPLYSGAATPWGYLISVQRELVSHAWTGDPFL